MPEVLKKQIFGLPRWAWLSILLAAVAIGLYLRHQRKLEEENGEGAEEGNVVSGPYGELIEPPYEGSGPYSEGGAGTEYFGGNELNLERQEAKEIRDQESKEAREIREEEKEERIWIRDHPGVSTETAPAAVGADSFIPTAEPITGTSQTPKEPKKKTASTGGGPPAKPGSGSKASGVIRGGDINTPMTPGQAAKSTAVSAGGGNSNPPAQNNSGGAPQNNQQHPAAVNTGNKCVNGGVGGHTPPSGYHLFCQGGWIWRAPNS